MRRILYGALIYVVLQLISSSFITTELRSLSAHGVFLLVAGIGASLITKQGIKLGKASFVIVLTILVLFGLYKFLQVSFFTQPDKQELFGDIYLFYFVALGIVSIAEELYFRGIVLEDLTQRCNVLIGSLASVIFFTFIHLDTSHIGLAFHFLSGIIFVLLYNKFKGVLLPSLAHMTGNWTVFFYINGI
ncbi:CPBP family intramembrane glutamic endopeptidase [Alteromonas gilva]|uniref:CPBP family intramembrane metalloprotease n=1 Tax=Alteromonas gilva TaxID=2987522 RepID=A0ABT5L2W0_9ALTE|nr:CPBP family intramembrane glutamic endopeptidase [Alteromonas gilva]MDC8831372.1 CPBP family intramembrane metalloprotease [Alteromonas gilva]